MTALPTDARVVIVGGGIIGCSTAYHLAKCGWKDILLLERARLTSGSTFHAAGLVGQLRTSANITRMLTYSVSLYGMLEAETGLATGWKQSGGLRLACNANRMAELLRQATTARSFGLPVEILSPAEAKALWPPLDSSDLVGAVFLPTDGQANPSDIAQALAKGARLGGVRIVEECPVTAVRLSGGRVAGVSTPFGDIVCEVVVNCGGQWAKEIGRLAGVTVPLQSVQHQYIVTETIEGLPRSLPTLRDPDRLTYFKEEVGGLVMGGYEPNPIAWAIDGIPAGFHFTLLDENWDHFEPLMRQALARVPALADAGVKEMINGPESFTPDGNFILGEAPEVRGFYIGAGFNAFGIASAGGAGKALAEWIAGGEPPMDLWPVDIRRFGQVHRDDAFVRTRTLEAYGKHYAIAWPQQEYETGRGLRLSPLYRRLADQGACFGSKLGWERPNWFAGPGEVPADEYSFGRPNWFTAVGREHAACRERVALFDQTSFAKFHVTGRDSAAALGWICANDVRRPIGAVIYTQMLNRHGGIECDLTVTRTEEDAFYLVTGTGFATHDLAWIRRAIPEGLDARVIDVTSSYTILSLMGPKARVVLQSLTHEHVSNAAFPFASCRELSVAGVVVRALRVSYVGELGWELHVPTDSAIPVYDALMSVGAAHGIANAGYRAIESLRLEKAYRAWGSDIGPDYSPLEAGLGWAVKLGKDIPFLGREALLAKRSKPLVRRLAGFTVGDPGILLIGRESIYRNGTLVGWLSSGGWGYTIGANIGLGYVRCEEGVSDDWLTAGRYELEIATQRIPANIHLRPPYDPDMTRMKI
ncbi:MAG TPA: FAD-dependent oxidoreductase [Alphaproteobacteria bacterium]|nr:FAD-dependent oxidoreductase [Alphaproteobacteria bacterium]